jgi:hypothetical protein
MKLQRWQNEVLRTTDKFPSCTPVRELHATFQVQYIYDYVTKLCRPKAEAMQNYENAYVRHIRKGEALHRKYV